MLRDKILKKLEGFKVTYIKVEGNFIKLQIELKPGQVSAEQEILIKNLLSDYEVKVTFFMKQEEKSKFKKVIGISSGKGGVGKSTVSLHIAYSLKEMGYKVGLLDADIYAPSLPVFLNASGNPRSEDGRHIDPIKTAHGFQLLSMGLFLKETESTLWRGPMLSMAFTQFLEQGNWDCDYLIVDLPPGTADIHMACAKVVPDAEFLLVGMPSKVVYADVRRMYTVLRSLNFKVKGMIENMAYSICPSCSHKEEYKTNARIENVDVLMKLPIFSHFHGLNEEGYPADYEQGLEKEAFHNLAKMLIE